MKLSIGIVGLPNVGKSTLFQLLTKKEVNIANYPFATIEPNIGIVSVPDERLSQLVQISHSQQLVPAIVEFYDIAGLVKGAYKGEGLGNQFLAHIRETNAIVLVLRCFRDESIVHIEGKVEPKRDLEIVETELILKDLETIEKVFEKTEKETRKGDKNAVQTMDILKIVKNELSKGKLLFQNSCFNSNSSDFKFLQGLNLLTMKPQIAFLNSDLEDIDEELKNKVQECCVDYVISNLSRASELGELIKKSYKILNLISFFTSGEQETRAWTIKAGTKAPEAAGVIHSDFETKFIKAEVVSYNEFLEAGGWQKAKQKGWVRLEGRDYVVKEGDVMFIKI